MNIGKLTNMTNAAYIWRLKKQHYYKRNIKAFEEHSAMMTSQTTFPNGYPLPGERKSLSGKLR